MMNPAYWDAVASDYGRHVLSVFDHENAARRIRAVVEARARPKGRAADLGCGVGKLTPWLAERFAGVEACDFSPAALAQARRRCRDRRNVRFWQFDFTSEPSPFEPVDLVLCVNVLIMASLDARMRAWRLVTNQVKQGGALVLVLPAHESWMFWHFRLVHAALGKGLDCAAATACGRPADDAARDLPPGVHPLEGIPTKHYLREELEVMLDDHHFDLLELEKLEYPSPADARDQPLAGSEHAAPVALWDWLVVGRRR